MIVGTVRIVPEGKRAAEVMELLRSIAGPVRAVRGCLSLDIYEECGPDQAIVLVERWDTQEALEAHLRSSAYLRVLKAIELSAPTPGVRFDYVSASEGMDLVARCRGKGPPRGQS